MYHIHIRIKSSVLGRWAANSYVSQLHPIAAMQSCRRPSQRRSNPVFAYWSHTCRPLGPCCFRVLNKSVRLWNLLCSSWRSITRTLQCTAHAQNTVWSHRRAPMQYLTYVADRDPISEIKLKCWLNIVLYSASLWQILVSIRCPGFFQCFDWSTHEW